MERRSQPYSTLLASVFNVVGRVEEEMQCNLQQPDIVSLLSQVADIE